MIYSNETLNTQALDFEVPFFVQEFWDEMDEFPDEFGPDIWAMRKLVTNAFEQETLTIDVGLARQYLGLEKYFPYELMPFQRCALGLWLCCFNEDGDPRWPDLYILAARGTGKDGFIAFAGACLTSPFNKIQKYDVDICAMNEEQAMRPLEDFLDVLTDTGNTNKLKKYWYWTKEVIQGKTNKGKMRGRTNNPKGRDGMRSGCIIFNEKHAYTDYKNIEVFETGLGKVEHPRSLVTTTDGNVVDGPLDADKQLIADVLAGNQPDDGLLPFVFRITSEDEIRDEASWRKANPRLKRSSGLFGEYKKQFRKWEASPDTHTSFPTKRLNFRKMNREVSVTDWSNLEATNKPMPDLTGFACVVGIDYAKTSDWVAVNLHFKKDDERYDINHAWVCRNGADFQKLNCPVDEWESRGLLTIVDEPDIKPRIVADYIRSMSRLHPVMGLAIDSYRWTLLSDELSNLGFSLKRKNLRLVRPSDIMRTYPILESVFQNQQFTWGDQPVLRWATNNAKLVPAKKSAIAGTVDAGNFLIGKIEPIKRKTDPFMALVASMCIEDLLPAYTSKSTGSSRVRVRKY